MMRPAKLLQRAIRQLHTPSTAAAPLTLRSISPLIRPHRPPPPPPSTSALSQDNHPKNRSNDGQINHLTSQGSSSKLSPSAISEADFLFWPNFFSVEESKALLAMGLWKLDRVDTTRRRRGRKAAPSVPASCTGTASGGSAGDDGRQGLEKIFDGEYGFEEGHYDSVIHQYRETLLSSLPPGSTDTLTQALSRLYALLPTTDFGSDPSPSSRSGSSTNPSPDSPASTSPGGSPDIPPQGTITHLLHLAPEGEILPHVDNLEASGKIICGVSLGAERTLRLARPAAGAEDGTEGVKEVGQEGWDVRLPSGSVYLQRDTVRYNFAHSILPFSADGSVWDDERLKKGHRLSIMIRDAPTRPARL